MKAIVTPSTHSHPGPTVVQARIPLVKGYNVPLGWLLGLKEADLAKLYAMIVVAEKNGINWRDWPEQFPAREVVDGEIEELLPLMSDKMAA